MIFQSQNGPSKAAFGDVRFPPNDRGSGEIVTYTMPKDEIRKRYKEPLYRRISKKELYQMRQSGMSNQRIAEWYGVNSEAIKALFQFYRRKKE